MAHPHEIYARAIFESADEAGISAVVFSELTEVASVFSEDKRVYAALSKGLIDANIRISVVQEVLKSSGAAPLTQKFVCLLAKRSRLAELNAVVAEFGRLLNQKSGVVVGDLRSAVEMAPDELSGLSQSIGKRIGSKVELRQRVDSDLLGGFVATVSGRTFDSSLRTQIEKLRTSLSQ
jgi:F-type H+-transporting ATPase subunit delta